MCVVGITNAAEDSSGEESDEEEEDGGAVYQGIPVSSLAP